MVTSRCLIAYILAVMWQGHQAIRPQELSWGRALATAGNVGTSVASTIQELKLAKYSLVPEDLNRPPELLSKRFWDDAMLQEGVMQAGYKQLFPLFDKLNSGKPITVVAFGTSISDIAGCWYSSVDKIKQTVGLLRFPPQEQMQRCTALKHGYLNRIMRMINTTWPHADHVLVNLAISGATPRGQSMRECLEDYLPARPDLVILEQVSYLGGSALDMETFLVRLAKAWGSLPAFVFLTSARTHNSDLPLTPAAEAEGCTVDCDCMRDSRRCDKERCRVMYSSYPDVRSYTLEPGETTTHATAAYYGFTSLSTRNMLGAWVRDGLPRHLNLSNCQMMANLYSDHIHIFGLGHVLYADMILSQLAAAERQMLQLRAAGEAGGQAAAGGSLLPAFQMVPAAPLVTMRCYVMADPKGGEMDELVGSGRPPPALRILSHSASWNYTEYQVDGANRKRKPGWVGTEVHSYIEVELNTDFADVIRTSTPKSPGSGNTNASTHIAISHLESYQHMGKAVLSCTAGCTCEPLLVNGHTHAKHSIPHVAKVPVSQHRHCRVRVTIVQETESGEHKFKLIGVGAELEVVTQPEPEPLL